MRAVHVVEVDEANHRVLTDLCTEMRHDVPWRDGQDRERDGAEVEVLARKVQIVRRGVAVVRQTERAGPIGHQREHAVSPIVATCVRVEPAVAARHVDVGRVRVESGAAATPNAIAARRILTGPWAVVAGVIEVRRVVAAERVEDALRAAPEINRREMPLIVTSVEVAVGDDVEIRRRAGRSRS